MDESNLLPMLRDGEICEVLVRDKWQEVVWCRGEQHFLYLSNEEPFVFRLEDIEEWRPASAKF